MTLRLRRGTDLQRQGIVLAEGELVYVTDTKEIYAGDGSTLGGIKVTGDILGSPPRLTQNLDLDGYTVNGIGAINITGSVTATGFIGDGSGLTNLPTGAGVVEGQEYAIDILGSVRADNSTLLVDSATESFYGNFVGNGSLLSNITLDQLADVNTTGVSDGQVLAYNAGLGIWQPSVGGSGSGVVDGSNYRINIVGNDSSVIVDTASNTITGNFNGDGSLLTNIDLNQINEFNTFGLAEGDTLIYTLGNWTNITFQLNSFTDVDAPAPNNRDVLYYDGSIWRAIDIDQLANQPGSDHNINIIGDDSTRIIDGSTGNITGNFIGDGSLITNLELNQNTDVNVLFPQEGEILKYVGGSWINVPETGIVEGSNYRINIRGDDSSILVDTSLGRFNGDLYGSVYSDGGNLLLDNVTQQLSVITGTMRSLNLEAVGTNPLLRVVSETNTGTFGVPVISVFNNHVGTFGQEITFNRSNGTHLSPTSVSNGDYIGSITYRAHDGNDYSTSAAMHVVADSVGGVNDINSSIRFFTRNGAIFPNFGVALELTPDKGAKVTGYLGVGGYTSVERNSLTVTAGTVVYNETISALSFFDGTEWRDIIHADSTENFTNMPGAVIITGIPETTRDIYGQDSVDLTGAVIYNSTSDRFEFFQAGSWVQLPNNGTSAGQVLTWDGAKWEATAPATGGSVVSADQLDGFDGPYYLDYNNFTNTPALFDGAFSSLTGVPTTLAGYGITDAATSAQGALADTALQPADIGSFTFTGTVLDTSDSSGITVTPAVTFSSDVSIENSLTVTNKITVDTLEVANLITAPTAGTPEISSDGAILLTAATRVEVSSSPLKMASFTTAERDVLSAENGDMIYNTSTNKFQGYANGVWVDLH